MGDGPRTGGGTTPRSCTEGGKVPAGAAAIPLPEIHSRTLEAGDLVQRRVLSREGLHKLSPMWEGPFKVVHVSRPGAARLERQDGVPIQNAWNIQHLQKFYP